MSLMFQRSSKRQVRAQSLNAMLESLESRTLLSTYYVAPTGSDNAAGTQSAPLATLQAAANKVKAGDTVIVQPGQYAGFVLGWDYDQSGTAGAPITFKGMPGATITSRNNKTPDGIDLEGASYITIDGFTINNADGSIQRAGIRAIGDSNVLIQNNYTTQNGTWGIYTSHTTDVTIQNNTSSYNNNTTSTWNHHGIYVSNSAVRPIVRNNVVFGNIGNGIHFNGDASQGGDGVVTGALVEGNIVYDNGTGGGSAINCDGISNSIIRNNLLYNNHRKGIALYQIDAATGSQNNVVENNTVIQAADGAGAMNVLDGSTGNRIRNNIFLGGEGSWNLDDSSLPGLVSDYNVVDKAATAGADQHSVTGTTPAQLFVNPSAGDFHLAAGSPAIGKGIASQDVQVDGDGNVRPASGTDIGAYEFQSGKVVAKSTPGSTAPPMKAIAATTPVASSTPVAATKSAQKATLTARLRAAKHRLAMRIAARKRLALRRAAALHQA